MMDPGQLEPSARSGCYVHAELPSCMVGVRNLFHAFKTSVRCDVRNYMGTTFLQIRRGEGQGDFVGGVLHINVRHEVPRSLRVSFTWLRFEGRAGMDGEDRNFPV